MQCQADMTIGLRFVPGANNDMNKPPLGGRSTRGYFGTPKPIKLAVKD